MRSLDQVRAKVEANEYDHKDVLWLLQEVDRYRAIDKAMIGVMITRNERIRELEKRVRMYEVVKS